MSGKERKKQRCVRKRKKKTHLQDLIVQIQTKHNSPPEYLADFRPIIAFLIHPFSCTIRPSITPSRMALPTMYSASSSESKWSLTQISLRRWREGLRIPVLITF
jgi:hypothetical protein